jgi:phthalate 4,5-dioxygenase
MGASLLNKEENQLITRVGRGTPMGEVMRRYWMPCLLASELPGPDCPPVRVRLLGEDLVAFRDTNGQVGLLDELCPHRLASLFLGRNEESGLRCVYHGWKFDVDGHCVDMPSEPAASTFKERVRQLAYPTVETAGVVWAYLGPTEKQPDLPDMEWMRAPDTHLFVSVTEEYCNFVQCVEGGIDTVHSSYLHNNNLADKTGFRQIATSAQVEVARGDFGFQYAGIREISAEENYVRMYTFVMPFHQIRSRQNYSARGREEIPTLAGHMWVPQDDEHTLVFNWMYAADDDKPLTPEFVDRTERGLGRGPEGETRQRFRIRANDWGIDRAMQRTVNFTGIPGTNSQDLAVQESMGATVDRSREHLGTTDRAVIAYRQLLLDSIKIVEDGGDPPGLDPSTYRQLRASDVVLPKGVSWQDVAEEELVARR